jgi:formamidopyrimidine-DNA glycosylase
MAELPEIETLRRELDKELAQKKIKTVDLTALKSVPRYKTKKGFTDELEGRKILGLERKGPFLVAKLEGGAALMIDLGTGGQLVRAKSAKQAASKGTQAIFTFTQGGQLRIVDTTGHVEMWVMPYAEIAEAPELAGLGLDPLDAAISWEQFGRLLYQRAGKLTALLNDRTFIVGIGPAYSDEILFAAGLRHDRESNQLTGQEVRRLYRAVIEIMQDAVKFRGSNHAAKASSGDPFDEEGSEHFKVWERAGETCRRCRRELKKAKLGSRSIYFCEACQV